MNIGNQQRVQWSVSKIMNAMPPPCFLAPIILVVDILVLVLVLVLVHGQALVLLSGRVAHSQARLPASKRAARQPVHSERIAAAHYLSRSLIHSSSGDEIFCRVPFVC
jgi:uncharacterized protein YhhL (DUF1145 family)